MVYWTEEGQIKTALQRIDMSNTKKSSVNNKHTNNKHARTHARTRTHTHTHTHTHNLMKSADDNKKLNKREIERERTKRKELRSQVRSIIIIWSGDSKRMPAGYSWISSDKPAIVHIFASEMLASEKAKAIFMTPYLCCNSVHRHELLLQGLLHIYNISSCLYLLEWS